MTIVPRSNPFADLVAELLTRGHRARFRVEGVSMLPTIRGGDTITVEPVSKIDIRDIVVYRAERGLIAHRVVGVRKENGQALVFLTRGDTRDSTEEPVQEPQVLGKVVTVNRNGRAIDLGGRWTNRRRRVRSALLLAFALIAVFSNAARANISMTTEVNDFFASGNTCTISPMDASTGGPNVILTSMTGTNANSFSTPTTTGLGTPTITLLISINNATADLAIWSITNFTGSTNASITITSGGGSGGEVCGAAAYAGVSGIGTITSATGTSTAASVAVNSPGPGGVVFDSLSVDVGSSTATVGGSQVQEWNHTSSAGRVGAASISTPTTTMSWTVSPSDRWTLAGVPLIPLSTTEVQTRSFTVTQRTDRNVIELTTGREVSSLGFNLYREQNGERVRLNASLLAGTALLAGSEATLTAGHVHTWSDTPSRDAGTASYWVEEVDLDGQRSWYGPATPTTVTPTTQDGAPGGRATSLGRVGRDIAAPGVGVDTASRARQTRAASTVTSSRNARTQYALAAGPGVKLGVHAEGWYQVAWRDLVTAGLDPNADANSLQLYAEGVEQPIVVQGQTGHLLSPQGNIQFYGTGLDTTWSDTRVYWLTWGNERGRRVRAEALQRRGAAAGPASFPFTVEWKPRTVYFAALLNGDADNFFGPVLTPGEPVSQAITITHLDRSATDGAQLRVALQGVSLAAHRVGVALNGSQVGTVTFSGQAQGVETLDVPEVALQEGSNLLTLTVEGAETDVTVVDSVELTYPHSYIADSDALHFTASGGQAATIVGFSNSQISVVDITEPEFVTLVPCTLTKQAEGYAVTIVPEREGMRTLLAFTNSQNAQPASITAHHPTSWHAPQAGFDMVMISHANFVESVEPLVTLHESEGRKVAVIDVEDLYDEFSFGEKSPYALKDFLTTAKAQWHLKPRFVLLVGDATYDPRSYLGGGDFDLVPTYLVDTALLETASDDWFADFSGQGVPQMAIGRLPVRTAQDAAALVSKIVKYGQPDVTGWKKRVLLVADQNDSDNNFEADAAAIRALLPGDLTVSQIFQSDPGARTDLLNGLNVQGAGLVNYIGHGSEAIWAGALFNSTDADGLTNGSMVPFVVSMTCLNGYFQDIYGTALAKALIEAPRGGALAVWASSGLTDSAPQAVMNQALIAALFGRKPLTLGEAAMTAKAAIGNPDVRRTWILFGDPALKLRE